MCGIYGYIGKNNAYEKVLKGLSLLQYRGYDSCGIAYYDEGFKITKAIGTLENLKKCETKTNLAFGHTRWATNGIVNVNNAHPHVSYNGEYTIVHNGIIKNSDVIKKTLIDEGIHFYSDTDTEVIANYLTTINIENLNSIFTNLEGTFSLIIGTSKGELYLVKQFSPLHILKADDGIYVSSDISSLPNGELYSLKDNDIIKISNNNIERFDKKALTFIEHKNIIEQMQLDGYKHYMIKEIYETPESIKNTYYNIKDIDFTSIFNHYNKITFLGCGTAYNSCLVGDYLISNYLNLETSTFLASNYVLKKEIDKRHLHIIVSQSGETADCIKVAEQIKRCNGKILLITNEPTSTMARLADEIILTKAKKELAVASTKTYCCQVFIFAYICQKLIDSKYEIDIEDFITELTQFLTNLDISNLANQLKNTDKMIMIGKDLDYLTLLEASLKIREIDYVYTLPMFAGELKHGTLSLIEKDSIVLTLNSSEDKNNLNATINEIRSREGIVIEMDKIVGETPKNKFYKAIYNIIPFQLLSYYIALFNGRNPDMPRNLAKSVTVE